MNELSNKMIPAFVAKIFDKQKSIYYNQSYKIKYLSKEARTKLHIEADNVLRSYKSLVQEMDDASDIYVSRQPKKIMCVRSSGYPIAVDKNRLQTELLNNLVSELFRGFSSEAYQDFWFTAIPRVAARMMTFQHGRDVWPLVMKPLKEIPTNSPLSKYRDEWIWCLLRYMLRHHPAYSSPEWQFLVQIAKFIRDGDLGKMGIRVVLVNKLQEAQFPDNDLLKKLNYYVELSNNVALKTSLEQYNAHQSPLKETLEQFVKDYQTNWESRSANSTLTDYFPRRAFKPFDPFDKCVRTELETHLSSSSWVHYYCDRDASDSGVCLE